MELREFFERHPKVALAFSGGVDSTYLLHAAVRAGADVRAYTVNSAFQPRFEIEDARRAAREIGSPLRVIDLDVLSDDAIAANAADRCYRCKRAIMEAVAAAAREDGYEQLIDGTNASDATDDRPGMRALEELSVLSPLRLCGVSKAEVRRRAREAGLFTWDKPAYACLATRVPTGEAVTAEALAATEAAEEALAVLGFSDVRVRWMHGAARVQVPEDQLARAVDARDDILAALGPLYSAVVLDLEPRPREACARAMPDGRCDDER